VLDKGLSPNSQGLEQDLKPGGHSFGSGQGLRILFLLLRLQLGFKVDGKGH
jgi:hypothetical protein